MAKRRKLAVRNMIIATAMTTLSTLTVTKSASAIECVIYARQVSDFSIRGDAWTWWAQAKQTGYGTGRAPQSGAAIVFKRTAGMRRGHVGVVRKVVSSREVVIDHANWSGGRIDRNVSVIDVSRRNDWSQVRVWYPRINDYGNTIYPVYGFIYDHHGRSSTVEASYQRPAATSLRADRDLIKVSAPEHPMLSDRFGVSVLIRDGKSVVMGHPVVSSGDLQATPAVARDDSETMRRSTKETDPPVVLASFDRTTMVKLPAMPTLRPMTKVSETKVSATKISATAPEANTEKLQDKSVVDRNPGLFGTILSGLKVKPGSQIDKKDNGFITTAALDDGPALPVMPTRRPGSN